MKGRFKILSRGNLGTEYHVCMSCYFNMIRKSKGHLEKYVPEEPEYVPVEASESSPPLLLERVKEQIKQEAPKPEPMDVDPIIMLASMAGMAMGHMKEQND